MAVDLVKKYYRFEYDVTLEISFKPQLNFPVVTICNLNPILKSQLLQRPAFQSLFKKDFDSNAALIAPLINDSNTDASIPLPTSGNLQGSTVAGPTMQSGGTGSSGNSGTGGSGQGTATKAGTGTATKAGAGTATGAGTGARTASPTATGTKKVPIVRRGVKGGVNDNIERPTPPANITFIDLDASHENYNMFSEISAELFNKLSDQKMYELGTRASRFIAKCTFKQKPCAAK